MTELISFDFPSLVKPRYHTVPRRYEETKPVVVQNFTHQRILGIGNQVHRQSLQKLEDEKLTSIHRAEQAVWGEAEALREEAVKQAKNEAKLELERTIKDIQREHEHKIKEETLKVEMALQKSSIEQIKLERANAEKQMKEALIRNNEKWNAQLKKAVERTREEERRKSKETFTNLSRKYAANTEELKRKATQEREKAIEIVIRQKDEEKMKAVQDAINKEVIKTNEQIEQLKEKYQLEINQIRQVISEKNSVIKRLEKDVRKIETLKAKVQKKLIETREEFQFFINRIKFFDDGQSDFLLPSLNLEEFES